MQREAPDLENEQGQSTWITPEGAKDDLGNPLFTQMLLPLHSARQSLDK